MDGAVRSALEEEIRAFPGQAAVLLARMPGEEILFPGEKELKDDTCVIYFPIR